VAADRFHQEIMIDLIEGRLDIKLHHPVESPAPLSGDGYRLFRRFSRPIPIRIRMEYRIKNRFDGMPDHGLRNAIRYGRNAQLSRASLCLRNLYLFDRRRNIRSRCPFAPLPLQELHRYYEQPRPSVWHRYSSSWFLPLVISLLIQNEALTFHTKACAEFMPPLHRLPSGP
jgi:hypothetical protein